MFEQNDKALRITRIIVIVVIGIFAAASVIGGIILAIDADGIFILLTFVGLFCCWLMWVSWRLFASFLIDVKLIRNKLYGVSNNGLDEFLKARNERSNSSEVEDELTETDAELRHLQRLLSSGLISNEEYERRKENITHDDKLR